MRDALIVSENGYGLLLSELLHDYPISRVLLNLNNGLPVEIAKGNFIAFAGPINMSAFFARIQMVQDGSSDKSTPASEIGFRQVVYREGFSDTHIVAENRNAGKKKGPQLNVEFQDGNWIIASSDNCPLTEFRVSKFPALFVSGKRHWYPESRTPSYARYSGSPYLGTGYSRRNIDSVLEERFYSEGSRIEVYSKPWLLDELWQEHFGKNWIPFALEDRIAKFPKAAQFFKERYPQVVPDEAWALLGGKPTAE